MLGVPVLAGAAAYAVAEARNWRGTLEDKPRLAKKFYAIVALSLILTIAPFAVVAPFLGPAIDRLQGGRRFIVLGTALGRVVSCIFMAAAVHSLLTHGQASNNSMPAIAFAAIADACGLLPKLTWWREQKVGVRRRLVQLRDQLPSSIRDLVDETEAAVGDAVVGRR